MKVEMTYNVFYAGLIFFVYFWCNVGTLIWQSMGIDSVWSQPQVANRGTSVLSPASLPRFFSFVKITNVKCYQIKKKWIHLTDENTHKQKNPIYLTKLTQLNPTRLNRRVNVSSYLNLFSHAAVCHWASRVKPLYQQAEGSLPRHHTAHPKAKHTIWTIPSTKRASINIFRLVENAERKGVWKSNVQRETENSRGSRVTLKRVWYRFLV